MKNDTDLTPNQRTLLAYLKEQIRLHGRAPSLREAALAHRVSHAAIAQTLKTLEKKNYLKRTGKYSRTLRLMDSGVNRETSTALRHIPIVGTIAAGLPLYAQQLWEGTIAVDTTMYTGDHLFALRIDGASMKDAGILDGDLVICEPRQFANNGDIVVALINHDDATVKRFYLRKTHIELKPENPDFRPVKYGLGEVLIQGKVIGLFRGPHAFGA